MKQYFQWVMRKMRIVNEKGLNLERKKGNKEPKSIYYIVTEGDKTELQYFAGINKNREKIGIKPLVEIITIENEENEFGQSHPLRKIENFNKSLENDKFTYSKEIDKVCFIVDRDKRNFKDYQYDDFVQKCNKYGYFPYISNPTFEIFLLMHSNKIFEFEEKDLLENKKVNRNKKFLEIHLSNIFACNKRNIYFDNFRNRIKTAIKNEKEFCEDINELKYKLGSNVGILINEMIGA